MAVYTHLSAEEMQQLISLYGLSQPVVSFAPIAQGVDNSNYLIELERTDGSGIEKAILTIFESRLAVEELPFFISLMEHLSCRGIPCPKPYRTRDGQALADVRKAGKKAAMVSFLQGEQLMGLPSSEHLYQLGELSARMHLAGKDYPEKRRNDLSLAGWRRLYERTAERAHEVESGLKELLEHELHYLMEAWPVTLPSGVVHADLFPDNVFFEDDRLCGVIDFYFSCNDAYLYDMAITMNAWCMGLDGKANPSLCRAFWEGYTQVRPVAEGEQKHLITLLRGAALRFLLTRLYDWLHPVEGALVTLKDPKEYVRKLSFHQQASLKDYGL